MSILTWIKRWLQYFLLWILAKLGLYKGPQG